MRSAIVLLALAWAPTATSQYVPFPTDSAEWIVQRTAAQPGGTSNISFKRYHLDGDTTLNDTLYHKLYETLDFSPMTPVLVAGIREEAQKVFARRITYNGLPASCQWDPSFEVMLYDYTLDAIGDSLVIQHQWIGPVLFIVYSIDSVVVNGAPRRRINCLNETYACGPLPLSYIEGVGSDRHPLDPFMQQTYEINNLIACFKRHGAFQFSSFPTPPLCDVATVGMAGPAGWATPLSAYQRYDDLVVSAPGATRIRITDSWGRVVHEQVLSSRAITIPLQWAGGIYHVQALDADGRKGSTVPVVLVR